MEDKLQQKFLAKVEKDFLNADASKEEHYQQWSDERKCYLGEQWDLSITNRSKKVRQKRPNSVDNFVFPAIEYKKYVLTSNTPDAVITKLKQNPTAEDVLDEWSKTITSAIQAIKYKNKYDLTWDKTIQQGLMHGPLIEMVTWNQDWVGGSGKNRWNGEVEIEFIDVRDFFPDPAITDLEKDFQDCEYVIVRRRKKKGWFEKNYPDKADKVNITYSSEKRYDSYDERYEGTDASMGNLYLYFHKGKPNEIPKKWKDIYKRKLERLEVENDYEKKCIEDMIDGEKEGVHLAIASDGVMLEYKPYIYDDGLYPFAYKVVHQDPNYQWGFGEIKNMIMPQIAYNKADEIQLEAFARQGLGSYVYQAGSIDEKQKRDFMNNLHKGGGMFEFDNVQMFKELQPVQTPNSLVEYKQYKNSILHKIVGYTNIQQGEAKSGTPFKAVQELGERADVRTIGIIKKAEIFEREVVNLIINRVKQFYTQKRTFKFREGQQMRMGRYEPGEMYDRWEREVDGQEYIERYFPEYDVKITIVDAKPTDRNYYINLARTLYEMQVIDRQSLLETIETGKLPSMDILLERIQAQAQAEQGQMPQQPQGGNPEELVAQLPPDIKQYLASLGDQEAMQELQKIAQMGVENYINTLNQV